MVFGGLLLIGGSGAAALYVGADRLLGPSYEELNGLECTTLQLVKIKRENYYWVRKYVFTEGGNGQARLKTALRVAKTVQAAEHADLVQVTVLDKSGPSQRADMRGRAIGAQVVYIPDPAKAPDPGDPAYSAFYVEGAPASNGEFFGLRIDMPLEDVEHLSATLTDHADCASPVTDVPAAAEGHGAKPTKKGAKGSGHEEPAAESSGHGDSKAEPGAEKAAPEAGHEGAPVAEGAGTAGESKGILSSVTDMIFGKSTEAAAAAPPPGSDGHAPDAAAGAAVPASNVEHTAVTEAPGFFDRVKGMILGGGSDTEVGQGTPAAQALPAPASAEQDTAARPRDGIDPMKVAAPTDAPQGPEKPAPTPSTTAAPSPPSH